MPYDMGQLFRPSHVHVLPSYSDACWAQAASQVTPAPPHTLPRTWITAGSGPRRMRSRRCMLRACHLPDQLRLSSCHAKPRGCAGGQLTACTTPHLGMPGACCLPNQRRAASADAEHMGRAGCIASRRCMRTACPRYRPNQRCAGSADAANMGQLQARGASACRQAAACSAAAAAASSARPRAASACARPSSA